MQDDCYNIPLPVQTQEKIDLLNDISNSPDVGLEQIKKRNREFKQKQVIVQEFI